MYNLDYSFIIIFIIFIIIINMIIHFKPKVKGYLGELHTRKALDRLPKYEYYVINNLLLNLNGKTHQIDHVVISKYGIFVIETKQYHGFITGKKYDKYWIRHTKYNKYYYLNPIRQNYGHVKTIIDLIDLPEINEHVVHNIVCFSGSVNLMVEHNGEIVSCDNLPRKIMSYIDSVVYNPDMIMDILSYNNSGKIKDKIKHSIDTGRKKKDKYITCPKCGGNLVQKVGIYGNFIGCSNYPMCRYKKNSIRSKY